MAKRRNPHRFWAVIWFAALLWGGGLRAAVPDDLQRLSQQQRFVEAYTLAKKWQEDYEGEPQFDLYYGLAALELGHLAEAILAFDRLLIVNPNAYRARLEMARAHFLLADYVESRAQFERVLAASPPPLVASRIYVYLDMLTAREKSQRTASSVVLVARVGHSSNINSATTEDYTNPIPGLNVVVESGQPEHTISIDKEQQAQGSEYSDIETQFSITRPINTKRAQFLTASYRRLAYRDSGDYNIDTLNVSAGYLFRSGISQFRIPLSYQGVLLDGEMLRYSVSLALDVTRPLSAQLDWLNFGVLSIQRYKEDIERDTDLLLLGSGVGYTTPRMPIRLFGSVMLAEEHERDVAVNGRTYGGVRLSAEYMFGSKLSGYLYGTSQLSTYHDSGFFEDRREDVFWELILGARWRYSRSFVLSTDVSYTDNDSNTVIYDYERTKWQMTFRYIVD